MFVNLSRRTQGLVERQLRLIDDLELGEQDADRLGSLFRLDHLATRLRRNGENLLVLAGAELRQRSGEPVPVVDVLRAAVSEIEDYQRVLVQPLPRAMVSGLAVNDIVHLVAELLDNAAAYSDPETQVELSARFGDEGGLVVEIRDAGTGLRRPQLIDINQRLAVPSAIDVSVSRHMGLFVVGRLANRPGISVQLTSSDGSGVTVTVALPKELITTEAASALRRSDYLGRLASQDVSLAGAENGSVSYRPSASPNYQTSFADAVPSQQPGLLDDPTSINGNTDDTPIFASMLSRWFTEREDKPAAADEFTYYAGAATEQEGWESDADAGWQAAEAASEPAVDEITAAGLPKRRPQALLVPGSAAARTDNERSVISTSCQARVRRPRSHVQLSARVNDGKTCSAGEAGRRKRCSSRLARRGDSGRQSVTSQPVKPSSESGQFGWLLTNFVKHVPGVSHAVAVSSDGLLLTSSDGLPRDRADQLAGRIRAVESDTGCCTSLWCRRGSANNG
jgi:anti-sigma regulatory factor (Ser/Thr protein kinase)